MTEINTFSSAVDLVIERSGRPNLKSSIISYVRLAIRELQSKVKSKNDLIEDQLLADASPFVWEQPQNFRQIVAVKYPGIYDGQGNPIYPRAITPSSLQNRFDYYYYGSGNSFVFAGIDSGSLVDVAYLQWVPPLAYYAPDSRPAVFELETNTWSYATASTPDEQQAARDQVTNWILFNWFDAVVEGALAKLYKTVGDDRAVSTFALFKSFEKDFINSVQQESGIGAI